MPFVDPDPMLSYFTCDQVVERPRGPDQLLQRRELLRPRVRQALRAAEGRARPATSASRSSTRCSRASSSRARTTCSTRSPRLQAYRKGRFEGFVRQPAKIGPVVYPNTSPTYAQLKPVECLVRRAMTAAAAAAIIAIIAVVACSRWRCGVLLAPAPPHGRRAGVSARFVSGKVLGSLATLVFVVVLQLLPVPGRRDGSGREPLPRPQPHPEPARQADRGVRPRRVQGRRSSSPT